MVIALIICIPITAIVVGFLVLKSVQLGLKWQIQTAKQEQPEMKGPIDKVVEVIQENKTAEANQERALFMKEYSPFQG
jgi:hypothetical protein